MQVSYYNTTHDDPIVCPEEGVNATEGEIQVIENNLDESKPVWLVVTENGVTNDMLSDPIRGTIPNPDFSKYNSILTCCPKKTF